LVSVVLLEQPVQVSFCPATLKPKQIAIPYETDQSHFRSSPRTSGHPKPPVVMLAEYAHRATGDLVALDVILFRVPGAMPSGVRLA
jgi:hypothetical protein